MKIILSRHGESVANTRGIFGGDYGLTLSGFRFAKRLGKIIQKEQNYHVSVISSALLRTKQTARYAGYEPRVFSYLNEIDTGDCSDMTGEQIDKYFPGLRAQRESQKFIFRYPNGESYEDVVIRLAPLFQYINNNKRNDQLLVIICHQAVARMIFAFLTNQTYSDLVNLKFPLHKIVRFIQSGNGFIIQNSSL